MLYDKSFATEHEAREYAKEIDNEPSGNYYAVVLLDDGEWIVEVWKED